MDSAIDRMRAIAARLDLLDRRRVVFGAARHDHRFQPPLDEPSIAAHEAEWGVRLPAPYRAYLRELGNGGAGPFYGVLPLRPTAAAARPFPYTDEVDVEDPELPIDGLLTIAEYGCGIDVGLVVHGEAAGQVWWDARWERGLVPVLGRDHQRVTFDAWWLSIMGDHLARFERVWALMQAGAAHEAIHAELDGRGISLEIDQAMLSLMDAPLDGRPRRSGPGPWGDRCGWADEQYAAWRAARAP
jgi:hypothetical protein